MPKVSVALAIYNCAPTLEEAITSLLEQTYQDFEVIMCDDGSTDNTAEVAQRFVEKWPKRFKLLRNQKNLKLPASLNRCIEVASGEYIARMDGDDVSLPDRFEKQVKFLDSHPEFAVVSTPMIYFDENGDYRRGRAKPEPTREDFKRGTPFCHAPSMMRADALRAIGSYTAEPWVERSEDFYLWYKFYKNGYKGYNLPEPLYKMRNGRQAFSRRKASDRWRAYKLGVKVKKSLGLSHPYLSGIKDLCKILVPAPLVRLREKIIYRWLHPQRNQL